MKDLLFIEGTHQYFLTEGDGENWTAKVELPALTNILKAVGIIDTRFYNDAGRARGKAVHRALELIDRNELDWGSADPRTYGYIEAYLKFKEEKDLLSWADNIIEEPTYHKQKLYGCTPDRVIGTTVLDIKTGGSEQWHALQLTGCADALRSHGMNIDRLWDVYLKDNGTFKIVQIDEDLTDVWDAVLRTYGWTKEGRK